MCKLLCTTLSNLRFLRFWQGSTKNSLGSTRNLYQNLFQTILSNFGFEPRSKDVLSFGQILSNRKKILSDRSKICIKIFLKKFLSSFDCQITAYLHVHALEVSVLMCTHMYTFVHYHTCVHYDMYIHSFHNALIH